MSRVSSELEVKSVEVRGDRLFWVLKLTHGDTLPISVKIGDRLLPWAAGDRILMTLSRIEEKPRDPRD